MTDFKIILVEDNPNNIEAVKLILNSMEEIHLTVATSGGEALRLINKERFHLFLLDVGLPDFSGFELLEMIRSRSKLRNAPVVLISGIHRSLEDSRKGYANGAVDYILKPFKDEELISKVSHYQSIFRTQSYLSSELKEANRELNEKNERLETLNQRLIGSERKWRYLGENFPDIVALLTCDFEVEFANRKADWIAGRDGKILDRFSLDKAVLEEHVVSDRQEHEFEFEEHGSWFSGRVLPLIDDHGRTEKLMMILKDTTKEKTYVKRIEHLMYHDGLTGLYNRNFFEQHLLSFDIDSHLPCSVIIADMNSLKLINDAFGHHKGDQLLIRAGEYLQSTFSQMDLIARWGGDEFIILAPNTSQEKIQASVRRLSEKIFSITDDIFTPHFALGSATATEQGTSLRQLINEAEDRMYRNKLRDSKSYRSSVIESLKKMLFEKDFETIEHTERMERMAVEMARVLGMPSEVEDDIALLAALHDIGKITISDEVLHKQGPLTQQEWKEIRRHPEIGYNIAKTIPELVSVSDAILGHHEHWDGTGYPQGLKGEDIPILSRMIAVIDAYDVMTHVRPYKSAISHESAIEELRQQSGIQFDPFIVDRFLDVFE